MENEQLAFLNTSIADRIKSIDSRRLFYRKLASRTFIGTALLAALSTILLGLHLEQFANEIRITVLIISSIITIVTTYNALYNYKDLWIANNDALNRFYALKFSIEYYEKGHPDFDATAVNAFKTEYQNILNELNQVWSKTHIDNNQH